MFFLIWLIVFIVPSFASVNIVTPFVSVSVEGVVPGKNFSLVKNGYPALRIYNKGNQKVKVSIVAGDVNRQNVSPTSVQVGNVAGGLPSAKNVVAERSSATGTVAGGLPSASIIKIENPFLEIAPNSFAETDIIIFVPKEKQNFDRRFEAEIISSGRAGGNLSAGLKSKLIFKTVKKKNLWQKLKGIFKK